MAACCPSSSSSSSTSSLEAVTEREGALQHRLDQMRRERHSELKSIGQVVANDGIDNRQAALRRLLDPQQEPSSPAVTTAGNSSNNAVPTAAPAASAILVEVRGLSELRPVSRVLQSSAFRTELESLVRFTLSPRQQPRRTAPQHEQQPPQQEQQQLEQPRNESPSESMTELRRLRHEELVQEISELLHSQLVTGGLDGNFRARLDRELRARAQALPDGGQRAEAALRGLPPSGIQRNDFAHLGIWLGGGGADDEANSAGSADDVLSVMSVPISAAAAAGANTAAAASAFAGGAAVSRQLHSVQRELTDLRRTVRLLLGNQLETQRMIRQEVSAALAGRSAPPPPQAIRSPAAGACLICLTSRADTVMYRCGHLCLCSMCTARMRDSAAAGPDGRPAISCPVCRAPVVDTLRVFTAGVGPDGDDDS